MQFFVFEAEQMVCLWLMRFIRLMRLIFSCSIVVDEVYKVDEVDIWPLEKRVRLLIHLQFSTF